MNYKTLKRILDILLALTMLLLLWPLMLLIALIIKIDSRGPVIYKQERYNGIDRKFVMYKFRTMQVGARRKMEKEHENPKKLITRFGKVLRELHIDELPQLYNILRGDISFIGVRPQQEAEYQWMLKCSKEWLDRFKGSVGAVSIERLICIYPAIQEKFVKKLKNADYLLNMQRREDYDLYYVKNECLYNDVIILMYLVRTILGKIYCTFITKQYCEYDSCDMKWKNRKLY